MPELKWRTVKVELEFAVSGSESDGTAVDLISEQIAGIGEISRPRSGRRSDGRDFGNETGVSIEKPDIKSITIFSR
jgi:hypothetical protein